MSMSSQAQLFVTDVHEQSGRLGASSTVRARQQTRASVQTVPCSTLASMGVGQNQAAAAVQPRCLHRTHLHIQEAYGHQQGCL